MTVYTFCFLLVVHLPVSFAVDGKCGGTLTGKTGDLQTPNYPSPYPSYSRCSWLIQVPVGYKIQLQFYHFVVEDTYECSSDVVKIYDGRNSSSTLLGKYCRRKNPFKVESTTTSMFISFISDRSVNFSGFKATFTAVAVDTVKEMSFKRTLKNITAVLGKEVKFNCHIRDGSANVNFLWTKDGQILRDDAPNYSIRYSTVNKRSHLLLKKVTKSDAGVYKCSVSDGDMKKVISSYGNLFVKVPAVVTEGPSPMTVNVGDNVVLQCNVLGDPVPKISWYVNGQEKTSLAIKTNLTSNLRLKTVKDAVVNCTADNGFGVHWKTAKITVLPPPTVKVEEVPATIYTPKWSAPVIVTPPQNVTAELGHNVTLTCAAKGNPKPQIRWLVDDSKYYENLPEDENGVSHFTLTLTKDKTGVRCEAQNHKDIDSRTAYITVPKVEAVVQTETSGGFFDGTKFILIMAFTALFILVIVGVMLILYRRRNLKLQSLSSPVDLEKLQSNPIFQQHTNYYINPKLLSWEVPRHRMDFIKELGKGNGKFSSLFLGKISHASSEEDNEGKVALVMVKLLKEKHILEAEQENFEQDAIALTTFCHPYVQSLFGICVDGYPLCLVFEFTEHDENLHQFLIESGRGHCSLHRQADMNNAKPKLSNVDQISIAKQIANGMEYLADKGYVHRELCTKNCIIGKGMVVKISNLGFSWKGPNSDYYSLDINERALYPVRWLPLETIRFGTFAEDSDIWSFGVVLWEIYSSGMTPYYGMNEDEVISLVDEGDILPCPKECPKEMYEVMEGCWNMEPSERPRFSSIHQRISSLFNGVPV